MSNKFKGVAYWSVSAQDTDWSVKMVKVLDPVESRGLATVTYTPLPAADQFEVLFGDDKYQMTFVGGKGRGTVQALPSAGAFLACLVAIRNQVGGIDLVDDQQNVIPSRVRQSHPLFGANWPLTLPVAEALGLVNDQAFMERHRSVLSRLI